MTPEEIPLAAAGSTVDTLAVRDLRLRFRGYTGTTKVLHGVSMRVAPEERVALVGESGSGKTVIARAVLGLLQRVPGAVVTGGIEFGGRDLTSLRSRAWRSLRGVQMSMIFQDPTSSLNPVFMIGSQFHEVHRRANPAIRLDGSRELAATALEEVSIEDPDRVLDSYPFQLSGGMNQRVMIAMALANEPALLIADEPGTALDVTVQDQTLRLMRRLVESHRTSVLFISHNLGVVREFADRVYVIHRGRIVEEGPSAAIFRDPRHPYTKALMAAAPRITGGGIPEVSGDEPSFLAPREVHPPESAPRGAG